jgi:hypothetical protein
MYLSAQYVIFEALSFLKGTACVKRKNPPHGSVEMLQILSTSKPRTILAPLRSSRVPLQHLRDLGGFFLPESDGVNDEQKHFAAAPNRSGLACRKDLNNLHTAVWSIFMRIRSL